MKYVVFIPSRYGSSRLQGKPLIDLCGLPMVIRTYHQCIKVVDPDKVYILTDDNRIKKVSDKYNAQCIMSSKNCRTGTDRIAEAAEKIDADIYINVQGDEPIFNPYDLLKIILEATRHPDYVINGYCKINDKKMFHNYNIPKVIINNENFLLYMSRAGIPANKHKVFKTAFRQVCLYAFPKNKLIKFKNYEKKGVIESIEDIEILRFIEMGEKVYMIPMSEQSISVDTKKDIKKVRRALR